MGQKKSSMHPKVVQDVAECTDFNMDEILAWYRSFEVETPSGELDLEKFKNIYKQVFPNADSAEFAEHVFRSYDTDNNGTIDFREFMFGVYVMANGSLEKRLEWAFRLFDRDHDGSVSKDEMLEIIMAMYRMVGKEHLSVLLVDGLAARQRMEKIFYLVDQDGDVNITYNEFRKAALNDHSLMNLLKFKDCLIFPRKKSMPQK